MVPPRALLSYSVLSGTLRKLMQPPEESIHIQVVQGLSELPRDAWDACVIEAEGASVEHHPYPANPFLRWDFLEALESSGSVAAATGWQPVHLVAFSRDKEICGAMPLYLKNHSQGEYVFDYAWADALHRAGGRYYPKLQCSVPFTPVTGSRLLTRQGAHAASVRALLLRAGTELAKEVNASSIHITFPTEQQWHELGELGLLQRTDQQFHWRNRDYHSFDDFLSELSSKKRKNIRRERRAVRVAGLSIEWVTGKDLTEAHWDFFFRCYLDTGSRKWGSPYLTREFFSLVGERMAENILLILCKRGSREIAAAINFIGSDALYGRNWGCIEDHEFLHFEACYYQAIDFAIAKGLDRVEAGAQGAHKIARGYVPRLTYSAHWIAHEGLRLALEDYLKHERAHVSAHLDDLLEHVPFRKNLEVPKSGDTSC